MLDGIVEDWIVLESETCAECDRRFTRVREGSQFRPLKRQDLGHRSLKGCSTRLRKLRKLAKLLSTTSRLRKRHTISSQPSALLPVEAEGTSDPTSTITAPVVRYLILPRPAGACSAPLRQRHKLDTGLSSSATTTMTGQWHTKILKCGAHSSDLSSVEYHA